MFWRPEHFEILSAVATPMYDYFFFPFYDGDDMPISRGKETGYDSGIPFGLVMIIWVGRSLTRTLLGISQHTHMRDAYRAFFFFFLLSLLGGVCVSPATGWYA